jgi:hypothetical protein
MRQSIVWGIGLALCGATAIGAAQSSTPQRPESQNPTQRDSHDQRGGQVTVVGCLQQEKDVPGRQPSAAERVGIGEDFILTNASMQPASASGGRTGAGTTGGTTAGTAGTTGTAGTGTTGTTTGTGTAGTTAGGTATGGMSGAQSQNMYKISGLDNDKLRPHVGHRVEVMGRLEDRGNRGMSGSGAGTGATGTGTTGTGTTGTGTTGTGTTGTGTTGTAGAGARPEQSGMQNRTGGDLPQLEATSIRQVAGSCPAAR